MKNKKYQVNRPPGTRAKQKGVATLFTTIALLIGVTMISLNSSKIGVLELFMSNNFESRNTAFNEAESGLDALFTKTKLIVDLNDPEGQVYCTTADSKFDNCDVTNITVASGWPWDAVPEHEAQLIFEGTGCAPRTLDTGCAHVLFSHYTLRSIYDDTENNGGVTETVTGAMELLPKFN